MPKVIRKEIIELVFSVSVTTRKPRPGEIDGVNYLFVDEKEFDQMVENERLC